MHNSSFLMQTCCCHHSVLSPRLISPPPLRNMAGKLRCGLLVCLLRVSIGMAAFLVLFSIEKAAISMEIRSTCRLGPDDGVAVGSDSSKTPVKPNTISRNSRGNETAVGIARVLTYRPGWVAPAPASPRSSMQWLLLIPHNPATFNRNIEKTRHKSHNILHVFD